MFPVIFQNCPVPLPATYIYLTSHCVGPTFRLNRGFSYDKLTFVYKYYQEIKQTKSSSIKRNNENVCVTRVDINFVNRFLEKVVCSNVKLHNSYINILWKFKWRTFENECIKYRSGKGSDGNNSYVFFM